MTGSAPIAIPDAVIRFVRDTATTIASRITGHLNLPLETVTWTPNSYGVFRRERHTRPAPIATLLRFGQDLLQTPGYEAAATAIRSVPFIEAELGNYVVTDLHVVRQCVDDVLRELLCAALEGPADSCTYSPEHLDAEWASVVESFASPDVDYEAVVPLPGCSGALPGGELALDDNAALITLSQDHIVAALSGGVFGPGDVVRPDCVYGLRVVVTSRKEVTQIPRALDPDASGRFLDRLQPIIDRAILAMRLAGSGALFFPGMVVRTRQFGFRTLQNTYHYIHTPRIPGSYVLNEDRARRIQSVRRLLATSEGCRAGLIESALHRFGLACTRIRDDDRLVDLVIAAEALFLSDSGSDRGELRFRLALRAALLIESAGGDARRTYQAFRRGYNLRSKIVHGGMPQADMLEERSFVAEFEELLRLALRHSLALPDHGNDFRRADFWEDMILS
jgi:hypothetical protein